MAGSTILVLPSPGICSSRAQRDPRRRRKQGRWARLLHVHCCDALFVSAGPQAQHRRVTSWEAAPRLMGAESCAERASVWFSIVLQLCEVHSTVSSLPCPRLGCLPRRWSCTSVCCIFPGFRAVARVRCSVTIPRWPPRLQISFWGFIFRDIHGCCASCWCFAAVLWPCLLAHGSERRGPHHCRYPLHASTLRYPCLQPSYNLTQRHCFRALRRLQSCRRLSTPHWRGWLGRVIELLRPK
ncbi:hypothetical protein V8C35DRAFT_231235 [Trichoderma chlorosporum]